MNSETIHYISGIMHQEAEKYLRGIDSLNSLEMVKGLLGTIEQNRALIPSEVLFMHEEFIKSMHEEAPEDFMLKIMAKCCIYRT